MSTIITAIDPHSPAERAGIRVGERLTAINGHTVVDVLDYRFYGYDAECDVVLEEKGQTRQVHIRKAEGRDLGLFAIRFSRSASVGACAIRLRDEHYTHPLLILVIITTSASGVVRHQRQIAVP